MPYKMKEDTHMNLYNLQGILIMNPYLKKGQWQMKINSSQMTEGVYVIKVRDSHWITSTKVMIIH
jgi:hypothetical protein